MIDDLQQYIDIVSSERKGEDVRGAIKDGLTVVANCNDEQSAAFESSGYSDLDEKEEVMLASLWAILKEQYPEINIKRYFSSADLQIGILLQALGLSDLSSDSAISSGIAALHRTWSTTHYYYTQIVNFDHDEVNDDRSEWNVLPVFVGDASTVVMQFDANSHPSVALVSENLESSIINMDVYRQSHRSAALTAGMTSLPEANVLYVKDYSDNAGLTSATTVTIPRSQLDSQNIVYILLGAATSKDYKDKNGPLSRDGALPMTYGADYEQDGTYRSGIAMRIDHDNAIFRRT